MNPTSPKRSAGEAGLEDLDPRLEGADDGDQTIGSILTDLSEEEFHGFAKLVDSEEMLAIVAALDREAVNEETVEDPQEHLQWSPEEEEEDMRA